MSEANVSELNERVKSMLTAVADGASIEIVYWDRGGPPGPGYESNHLTLLDDGKGTSAQYLKVRYDRSNPPYRTDKYVAKTPERLNGADALIRTLGGPTFREENNPNIGGVTKISVTVSVAGQSLERLFYQHLPEVLKPLEQRALRTLELCEAEGFHTIEPRLAAS